MFIQASLCMYVLYMNLSRPKFFIHFSKVFKHSFYSRCCCCCCCYIHHTAFETEFAPWIASQNFVNLDHDHLGDRLACHRARPAAPRPLSQYQVCHRQVILNPSPQRRKFAFEYYQHKKGAKKYIHSYSLIFFYQISESWANSLMMTISKSRSMSASCAASNRLYSQTLGRSGWLSK